MAGLVSPAGLVEMLKTLMRARGRRALFLGMFTVLVSVIAADSPVAGKTNLFFTDSHILVGQLSMNALFLSDDLHIYEHPLAQDA